MPVRNFNCPETDEPCARGECSLELCVEKKRADAPRHLSNVSSVTRPAWRGSVRIGRRYTLRNGAIVVIRSKREYTFNTQGARGSVEMWFGNIVGTNQNLSWHLDCYYAPEVGVRPHELDIVGTAP